MEFDELSGILAFAEFASFSRAAERLHLSAPAVFSQIRRLENQLGGRLYKRVGRRLELTDRSRSLAEYARRILAVRN
jgi:DNA-binding transcriptional LysR family regulator